MREGCRTSCAAGAPRAYLARRLPSVEDTLKQSFSRPTLSRFRETMGRSRIKVLSWSLRQLGGSAEESLFYLFKRPNRPHLEKDE